MPKIPLAVQMYTLREDTARDFPGTLKAVADIGYSAVELAGHGGLSTPELKALLDELHLSVAGSHIALDTLETDLRTVVEDARLLGNRHIVVPYLPAERRTDAAAYKKIAETLEQFGDALVSSGLTLCYHNHNFEFVKQDNGEYGMDIILQNTSPLTVKAEMDTYWILKAGVDPVAYVSKYPGRVPLMHLKDRDLTDGSFAEVGTGDLPLDALVAAADKLGTEYLVVEQDVCKRPALESVTISYNNLKAKGYA